jgi:predicted nucleic acid-binding protein
VKRAVLDASALVTFFENHPGAATVENLLQLAVDGKVQLLMSAISWGEIYRLTWQTKGAEIAARIIRNIDQLPVEVVDVDLELTRVAAELSVEYKLPFVNSFAASLAVSRKARLATSDSDFVPIAGRIEIEWMTSE